MEISECKFPFSSPRAPDTPGEVEAQVKSVLSSRMRMDQDYSPVEQESALNSRNAAHKGTAICTRNRHIQVQFKYKG